MLGFLKYKIILEIINKYVPFEIMLIVRNLFQIKYKLLIKFHTFYHCLHITLAWVTQLRTCFLKN